MAALAADPDGALSSKAAIAVCYPDNPHLDHHRVAATRALRKLAEDVRYESHAASPALGGRTIFAATNARSLAIARVFARHNSTRSVPECASIVDDPSTEAYREAQADGFFDLLARRNAAWAEWRDDEADVLTARIEERIAQVQRERSTNSEHRKET